MAEAQFVSVTYREIAERFGIGIEGARLKAKRRAAKGLWRIIPGNHPQDIIRVEIPEDEFVSAQPPQRRIPNNSNEGAPATPPPQDTQRREINDLESLVELISKLSEQSVAMTDRLVSAERGKAEAEKEAAIVRASLESAESRLAELQEQHLTELKTLRDRMEAEANKASMELAEWKARPWWRRIAS